MNIKSPIGLIFLSLFVASCATSSNFDVKAVDAVSNSPIPGVKVMRRTLHYTGVKGLEIEDSVLGETDPRGILNIGRLSVNSKDHTLCFMKEGYGNMYLFIIRRSGQRIGLMVNENNEDVGETLTISRSSVIEIPMRRN